MPPPRPLRRRPAPTRACASIVTRIPSSSGPGRTASRQPRATVMRASVGAEDVGDPAARAGRQGLVAEGVLEPFGRDALGRPVQREQREELARHAGQRPRAPDHVGLRSSEPGVERHVRVALVAEQQQRPEQVVEPTAARPDQEDPRRAQAPGRRRERARGRSHPWRRGGARCGHRRPRRPRALPP